MGVVVLRTLQSTTVSQGSNANYTDEGDWANFKITVYSTGNSRLSEVLITGTMFETGGLYRDKDLSAVTSEFLPASDPAGAAIVCQGTVSVTKSHVDAGRLSGTAKVSC